MPSGPRIRWEPADGIATPMPMASGPSTSTMGHDEGDVLYLFLDESGDFDFGGNGSSHFYMTCVAARRPFLLDRTLTKLKCDVIERGVALEKFHACEDSNWVKTDVLGVIERGADQLEAYCIRIEKDAVPMEMREPTKLYSKTFEWIVDEVCEREIGDETRMVVVITDSLPQAARKRQIEGPLKGVLKRMLQARGIGYQLLHHPSCAWTYLQVTDYLSWAAQRWYSRGMDWPLSRVRSAFKEMGVVSFGETEGGGSR